MGMNDHCRECLHALDPHVLFMSTTYAGVMLCPEPGCQCCVTWATLGRVLPAMPDDETLATWRRGIQPPGRDSAAP